MSKKHMQEGEIAKNIKTHQPVNPFYKYRAKDFIAYKDDDLWQITFTYLEDTDYELHTKREGVRKFKTLDSVEGCLRKMGVDDFKVIINKKAHL